MRAAVAGLVFLSLVLPSMSPAAAPRDPSFRLANAGRRVVTQVYVSAASSQAWSRDQLGQSVLEPGRLLVVRLPEGQCLNDLRVVFVGGATQERRGLDTCSLGSISIE